MVRLLPYKDSVRTLYGQGAAFERLPGGRAMQHIRLDEDDVIKEVEANGFKLSSKHELVPKRMYMAIFVKK